MQFRTATPDDIPQLVELMNNQYARKKNEKYFFWQYFNSAYPTILYCAEVENKIIGMFGLQKRRLNNGLVCGQAIDMIIRSEYRGQGIFYKLAMAAFNYFDDFDFLFVLPNLNGKNAILKNLEFKNLASINNLVLNTGNYNKTNFEICTHAINNTCKFDYTEKIFDWRFTNHPDYQYTRIKIDEMNYAFIKVFFDPITKNKYGDIVYFESTETAELHKLIVKCCDNLFSENISLITTWSLPNDISHAVLKKIGFKDVIQERYFCLKTLKTDLCDINNINNWIIYQSDAEIY